LLGSVWWNRYLYSESRYGRSARPNSASALRENEVGADFMRLILNVMPSPPIDSSWKSNIETDGPPDMYVGSRSSSEYVSLNSFSSAESLE